MHLYIGRYVCVYECMCVCIYVCMYAYMYVCINMCVGIMCIYIYVCMYVITEHSGVAPKFYACVPQMSDSTSAGTPVIKPWLQ